MLAAQSQVESESDNPRLGFAVGKEMGEQLVQNLLPALLLVDPNAKLRLLRNEEFAEEKNLMMMNLLEQQGWWVDYVEKREQRREAAFGAWPNYPYDAVEEVEKYVDSVMRARHPGYVR